jgi:hypothetical protein
MPTPGRWPGPTTDPSWNGHHRSPTRHPQPRLQILTSRHPSEMHRGSVGPEVTVTPIQARSAGTSISSVAGRVFLRSGSRRDCLACPETWRSVAGVVVGGEERFNRQLGDHDVHWSPEGRDGAEERELTITAPDESEPAYVGFDVIITADDKIQQVYGFIDHSPGG